MHPLKTSGRCDAASSNSLSTFMGTTNSPGEETPQNTRKQNAGREETRDRFLSSLFVIAASHAAGAVKIKREWRGVVLERQNNNTEKLFGLLDREKLTLGVVQEEGRCFLSPSTPFFHVATTPVWPSHLVVVVTGEGEPQRGKL